MPSPASGLISIPWTYLCFFSPTFLPMTLEIPLLWRWRQHVTLRLLLETCSAPPGCRKTCPSTLPIHSLGFLDSDALLTCLLLGWNPWCCFDVSCWISHFYMLSEFYFLATTIAHVWVYFKVCFCYNIHIHDDVREHCSSAGLDWFSNLEPTC